MTYEVIYFTRTGNSKRVANKIAHHLNCEPIIINDHKSWKGIFGYVKAGFYSSTDKKVKITLSRPLDDYDEIIVVSPLWAGGTASAIRAFFKLYNKEEAHLVVTSIGSIIKERSNYKSVTDIVSREEREDELILNLINNLNIKQSEKHT